jgi:hypothetical protein
MLMLRGVLLVWPGAGASEGGGGGGAAAVCVALLCMTRASRVCAAERPVARLL